MKKIWKHSWLILLWVVLGVVSNFYSFGIIQRTLITGITVAVFALFVHVITGIVGIRESEEKEA